jgi:hypothetical protein
LKFPVGAAQVMLWLIEKAKEQFNPQASEVEIAWGSCCRQVSKRSDHRIGTLIEWTEISVGLKQAKRFLMWGLCGKNR